MRTSQTREWTQRAHLPTYGRFDLEVVRGEGSWLWDEKGERYLDFVSGIATCSLGHAHPEMREALQEQAGQLLHCSNLYYTEPQARLAEALTAKWMTRSGQVFFGNSGAEVNDGLIKVARRYAHQRDGERASEAVVVTFRSSFHGRTLGSMAATGQDKIKVGFDPLLPGFVHLPLNDVEALEEVFSRHRVAAVLLEAIQGEGGVREAQGDFLRELERRCQKARALLFFDEIQAGIGRTGHRHGWEGVAPEIQPDGVSWAKGLGGGFPIGAFWVARQTAWGEGLAELMGPGSHGSTYGGNPLACAVSHRVLEIIERDHLIAQAQHMEQQLRTGIEALASPVVTELRGRGLLLGVGLVAERISREATDPPALAVTRAAQQEGLLVVPAGPDTVRLLPPLNVAEDEISEGLARLGRALKRVEKTAAATS